MNLVDRARVGLAVGWYGLWLERYDVPRRPRRDLKRELRANLADAAGRRGARAAVASLGGLRALALAHADAAGRDERPRWTSGILLAAVAAFLVPLVQVLAAVNFMAGVEAVDGGTTARGALVPFPGSAIERRPLGDGFEATIDFGPTFAVVAVVVFLVVARPWRLLRRRPVAPAL